MKYLHDNEGTFIMSYTTMNALLSESCDKKNTVLFPSRIPDKQSMRNVTNYDSKIKEFPGI